MSINQYIHHHVLGLGPQLILALPFVMSFVLYILAVVLSNRRYKKWPLHRTILFSLGICCAVVATAGPLAGRAHLEFTYHMFGHLLLGMLAPLLIVLAAPMTLLMRTVHVSLARHMARFLRGKLARLYLDPIFTTVLNIGGLWILYTTDLYVMMHQYSFLHLIVHFHVFFAGYLFTVSMIDLHQTVNKVSFLYRSIVLVLALAAHGILSKYIYVFPPSGVASTQAERGAMLMYYGGDVIDMIIIYILCLQWYRSTRPHMSPIKEYRVM